MGEDRRRRLTAIKGGLDPDRPRPSILMTVYTILVPIGISKEMEQAYQILRDAHVPGTETSGKWWETCFLFGVKMLTNNGLATLQPKNPCGQPGHPVSAFIIDEEPSDANGQQGSGYCSICRDIAEREVAGGTASADGQAGLDNVAPPPPVSDDTALPVSRMDEP